MTADRLSCCLRKPFQQILSLSKGSCTRPAPNPVYILRGAGSPVTALDFTQPATGCLLSACLDGHVHFWDLATRRIQSSFQCHNGQPVLFLKASPDAQCIMTQGRDSFFKIWKNSGPDFVLAGQIEAEGPGFCSAVLFPQDKSSQLVAVPSKNSVIRIHDVTNLTLVQTLGTETQGKDLGLCMCMCAIPSHGHAAARLLAGYESGKVILWDVQNGKALHHWSAHDDAVMCLTYSSSLNKGFSGSVDEKLLSWCVTENDTLELVKSIECVNAGFNDVQLRPDDRILAAAGWDNQVRIFSAKSLKPLATLAYHRDRVSCVQFSQDYLLAAGSKDHLISVWDIYRTS